MIEVYGRHPVSSIALARNIVSAYVSNNPVPVSELPDLIGRVYGMLRRLVNGDAMDAPVEIADKATPAQVRKSVTPDGLISFIDGKAYKTLKRHLDRHGLTPRSYCERYGLPANYPMVASSYAEQRSQIAKAIGLGKPIARADQRRAGTPGSR
ncbi:MucR family transcriptional regulator [Methylobacterium sp. J-070]|uniref:MucR family transcriptional regulator n=1 Tax=Methylobacterium sp. J-070 TaxID=2836650 RepID=UPI001FB86934|nr:MucR family transcriptional regulator [Methylobacterium sp. J-070]MCJ2049169.1 MucR family transcriptional regulator [Methylobacterium sp. J-070]